MPVPAVNDGVDALVQGRADVSNHAIGVAKVKEADAAVGVRFLSLDCSRSRRRAREKSGSGILSHHAQVGFVHRHRRRHLCACYDIYMVGHKGLANEVVAHSLKAIWDNIDKLPPLNPQFNEWTRERAASPDITIPYHPAAVQFYKEKNLWNAKMDEAQKRLLAINP